MKRALRRYGEMSPSSTEGDAALVFIDYANEVLAEIRNHPYWPEGESLLDYVSIEEQRPVPDQVVLLGILGRYAFDQGSKKAAGYMGSYYGALNGLLHEKKYGGSVPIEMQVVDRES
jgi:hypothetical protein